MTGITATQKTYRPETNQQLLEKRYFQDGEEKWEDVARRVARHAGDTQEEVDEFFQAINSGRFFPSRMTYMGTDTSFASSCFVFPVEDSLTGIMQTLSEACQVQKYGGGTGYNFSKLRPKGDLISTSGGEASGPVSFMKLFHNAMEVVHRAGKKHAAQMGILNCDHPDIFDFIQCKDIEGEYWTFNISVGITDNFVEAVKQNGDWDLAFDGRIYETIKARDLWDYIVQHAWHNGDPGVAFLDTVNRLNCYPEEIEACNPCQPGFATVLTPNGIRTFDEIDVGSIIWSGKQWTRVVNKAFTGIKSVYRYRSSFGEFVGTEQHQVFQGGERVEAQYAETIDACRGGLGADFTIEDLDPRDIMDGLVIGDGSVHKASNNLVHLIIGENDQDYYESEISPLLTTDRSAAFANTETSQAYEIETTVCAEELPRTYERGVPDRFLRGSPRKMAGFLRGLFSANGSVIPDGRRIALKQSSIGLILDAQKMLSALGIKSYITINKATEVAFDNGVYPIKESYDLNVTQDRYRFMEIISFLQEYKCDKVNGGTSNRRSSGIVQEVKLLGNFTVYDITVEAPEHSYWTGGILASNCAEQFLPPHTSCNLGSIDLSRFVEGRQINWCSLEKTIRTGVRFLDGSVGAAYWPIERIEEKTKTYRNIGLGVMGWADMLIMLGVPYDSEEAIELAETVMGFVNEIANDESCKLGGGERKNTTVTSIAPTGSISLLAGCSSGIEPLFGIAMTKNTYVGSYQSVHWLFEKIAKEQGFYSEELIGEIARTGSIQNIDGIPDGIKELFKTAMEVDWEWHVRHQAAFQAHTDNAVSKTINLPNDATIDDVEQAFLLAHETDCKSITVYRDGSRQVQVLDNKNQQRDMCPNCDAILFMKDGRHMCVTCGFSPKGSPVSANGQNGARQPKNLCPECRADSIVFEEGCHKCVSCGFAECEI